MGAFRSAPDRPFQLSRFILRAVEGGVGGSFEAMACPCEILFDTADENLSRTLLELGANEAWRIEKKYSRYAPDNIVHRINAAQGQPVDVDEETARLIDFADHCYGLSDGLFDITSGVLRRAWTFNGGSVVPAASEVERLRALVGWDKVTWKKPTIRLLTGMEIDLGGIGKEYAVDRVAAMIHEKTEMAVLVNFGGDVAVRGIRRDGKPWTVGIEAPDAEGKAVRVIQLEKGALATSGDARKFVIFNGKRYGHILDPRSGWPVDGSPRSVTVAAGTCTEAGFMSTFGMLNGKDADRVLTEAGVPHWCY